MKRTNEKFPQNLAGQLMALTQGLREHLGEEVFATAVITATRTGCRVQTVALDCLDAEAITWAAGEMIIAFSRDLNPKPRHRTTAHDRASLLDLFCEIRSFNQNQAFVPGRSGRFIDNDSRPTFRR